MPLETIFLGAAAWIWDEYGKELTDKTLGAAWQQWDKVKWGRALVLFDGLDEVNRAGGVRERIIQQIEDFSREYHAAQVVITCRLAATEYAFRNSQDVELADFNQEQIDAFVGKWFSQDGEKHRAFRAEFYYAGNESIRELAATPILLTLLCLAFEETMTFAHQRAELYKDAIDALLRKWDTHRSLKRDEIYKNLSPERKMRLFSYVAAKAFEKSEYFWPERVLEKEIVAYLANLPNADEEIDGQATLKAIEAQHGLFTEQAKGIYAFSHLTFQEYFTAKYIADNEARGTVERLIDSHLAEARWREVFLLTASQLDQANAFFDRFRQSIDDLITADATLLEMMQWAARKTAQLAPPHPRPAAVRAIYYYLDRALDLALARTLALGPGLALDFSLTYTLQIGLNMYYGYDIKEIRQQAGQFALYLAEVIELSQPVPELQAVLVGLPVTTAPRTIWEAAPGLFWGDFNDNLQQIMRTHRDLGHHWKLAEEQVKQMERCFEANLLLLECLKLACVSDRQAIEDSLLLPLEED